MDWAREEEYLTDMNLTAVVGFFDMRHQDLIKHGGTISKGTLKKMRMACLRRSLVVYKRSMFMTTVPGYFDVVKDDLMKNAAAAHVFIDPHHIKRWRRQCVLREIESIKEKMRATCDIITFDLLVDLLDESRTEANLKGVDSDVAIFRHYCLARIKLKKVV